MSIGWIIPAYAGSTASIDRSTAPVADHPRIRGEHTTVYERTIEAEGSSPHTRGARRAACAEGEFHGIIPAYAGSTRPAHRQTPRPPDHPRIRGEHHYLVSFLSLGGGSSPHTRGAPTTGSSSARSRRIIPAYAGSTLRAAEDTTKFKDHPRIRGEHRSPASR